MYICQPQCLVRQIEKYGLAVAQASKQWIWGLLPYWGLWEQKTNNQDNKRGRHKVWLENRKEALILKSEKGKSGSILQGKYTNQRYMTYPGKWKWGLFKTKRTAYVGQREKTEREKKEAMSWWFCMLQSWKSHSRIKKNLRDSTHELYRYIHSISTFA